MKDKLIADLRAKIETLQAENESLSRKIKGRGKLIKDNLFKRAKIDMLSDLLSKAADETGEELKLGARVADLEAQLALCQWVSVEEPPKEGFGWFWVVWKNGERTEYTKGWYNKQSTHKWWHETGGHYSLPIHDVTHWKPITLLTDKDGE